MFFLFNILCDEVFLLCVKMRVSIKIHLLERNMLIEILLMKYAWDKAFSSQKNCSFDKTSILEIQKTAEICRLIYYYHTIWQTLSM